MAHKEALTGCDAARYLSDKKRSVWSRLWHEAHPGDDEANTLSSLLATDKETRLSCCLFSRCCNLELL
jgi:hypothetical protein